MHQAPLQFVPLASPPNAKALLAWRTDAGWSAPFAEPMQPHPKAQIVWVSVQAGKERIGIARLELAPPEFCFVADLIISSKHRARGAGTWFLKAIEQFCIGRQIKRLLLQPHAGTEQFYVARHFVDDPHVAGILKKDLNPFQRKLFMPIAK